MSYLKLFNYYDQASLKLLGLDVSSGVLKDAIKSSFERKTFRFPEKATKDWLISIKILKAIFLAQFKKQAVKLNSNDSTVAIFDCDIKKTDLRYEYVKNLSGDAARLQVGRSELINSVSLWSSILVIFSIIIVSPFVFCVSVLSPNKLKAPLHVLNTCEAFNLLHLLKKYKINKLHFFCIYENDTNLMAYALMKNGIFINKIPSEVPLSFWNKTVVADSLSLCFQYQQDEYELHKETMHVKELNKWAPENTFELNKVYASEKYSVKKGTVGFYSSGMWLREKQGRIDVYDNAFVNEKALLNFLMGFVKKNDKYKLVVFLHPIEKKDMAATQNYYNGLSESILFADLNTPNAEQFYNAEVGVTLFSTLSYERIFWGFKTLIYPLGYEGFPIKNSTFNKVCAKSEAELSGKLLAALEIGTNEFFETNGLKNYRYSDHELFKN